MTSPDPADAADRLTTWAPLQILTDLAVTVADTWRLAGENNALLTRLGVIMADTSALLNEIADGLRGPLATSIQDLIAENASLRASNTSLSAEDAGETSAAENVKAAFDDLASKFTADPSTPDVPPLDGGDVPA